MLGFYRERGDGDGDLEQRGGLVIRSLGVFVVLIAGCGTILGVDDYEAVDCFRGCSDAESDSSTADGTADGAPGSDGAVGDSATADATAGCSIEPCDAAYA